RERFKLVEFRRAAIAVQVQRPRARAARGDVVYVHGATFGADLSVFYPFDGRSWADALAEIGVAVWGFDFVGYGDSDRYPGALGRPAGALPAAVDDLRRVVAAIRRRNGDRPVHLLAHSRGGAVAARYAGGYAQDVASLVLFAPVVARAPAQATAVAP